MQLLLSNEPLMAFSRRVPTGLQVIQFSMPRYEYLYTDPFPIRVFVLTKLQAPDAQGFPIDSEQSMIEQAQEELLSSLPNDGTIIYMGRVIHKGTCVLVLYAKFEGILGPGPACQIRGSRYVWDVHYANDPNYLFLQYKLAPSAKEIRRIKDAEVLGALTGAGDQPFAPRPIQFYGLFEHQEWATSASQELAQRGFRCSQPSAMPGSQRYPWSLMFQKTSSTEPATIEDLSASAQETINNHGGQYDGWTCDPVPGR
jgi:hypothetical protein